MDNPVDDLIELEEGGEIQIYPGIMIISERSGHTVGVYSRREVTDTYVDPVTGLRRTSILHPMLTELFTNVYVPRGARMNLETELTRFRKYRSTHHRTWLHKSGDIIHMTNMSPEHIFSSLKMLEHINQSDLKAYTGLLQELKNRGIPYEIKSLG